MSNLEHAQHLSMLLDQAIIDNDRVGEAYYMGLYYEALNLVNSER